MISLKTKYMGLDLKNPIIVGSSGLTNNVISIKELAESGAGAVVLKSLFEEQILVEMEQDMGNEEFLISHPEMYDYLKFYEKQHILDDYLKLIQEAKQAVDIPIIASINCMSSSKWTEFAKQIENAGADGLELNIFMLPSDPQIADDKIKSIYLNIIDKVTDIISIPVSIKISYYFNNVAKMLQRFSHSKIQGLVLFNKFSSPDIDLEKEETIFGNSFSTPTDMSNTLRWIGIMSNIVDCDLCATTGIHNGKDALKLILAGASSVQIVSSIYKNSHKIIGEYLKEIQSWMEEHKYDSIQKFKGKLSKSAEINDTLYERVQFVKQYQK